MFQKAFFANQLKTATVYGWQVSKVLSEINFFMFFLMIFADNFQIKINLLLS